MTATERRGISTTLRNVIGRERRTKESAAILLRGMEILAITTQVLEEAYQGIGHSL